MPGFDTSGMLSPMQMPMDIPSDGLSRWLGAGISAFMGNPASLISNGIGLATGGLSNFINFERQKSLKQMDFDNNMKMFNAVNEYNDPSAMVERWTKAGFNPLSLAPNAGAMAASSVVGGSPNAVENVSGQFAQQAANMFRDSVTAENIKEQTKGQKMDNAIKEVELGMKPDLLSAELDDIRESANAKRQEIIQSEENVKKLRQEVSYLKEQEDYLVAQEGYVEYQKAVASAEARLKSAEAKDKEIRNEYGMDQSDPRFPYWKAIVDGKSQEEIDKARKMVEESSKSIERGKVQAQVENDPIARTRERLTKEYEEDDAYYADRIASIKSELRDYESGRKKDNYFGTYVSQLRHELKTMEGRRANNYKKYTEALRRIENNESIGVSPTHYNRSK